MVGAGEDGKAPGNFAHWLEQRKRSGGQLDSLISHGGGLGIQEGLSAFPVGGQVQIGKQDLVRPQQRVLGGLGLLDLDDEFGIAPHVLSLRNHHATLALVGLI